MFTNNQNMAAMAVALFYCQKDRPLESSVVVRLALNS
jgi:hypothetical protein